MKATQKQVIKDALENLKIAKDEFHDNLQSILNDIDHEKENIEALNEELQEEFDELGEKAQEGDKGTKLQEQIDNIENIVNELDNLRTELDGDPFEDVVAQLKDANENI